MKQTNNAHVLSERFRLAWEWHVLSFLVYDATVHSECEPIAVVSTVVWLWLYTRPYFLVRSPNNLRLLYRRQRG